MLKTIKPAWWVFVAIFLLHQLVQKGFGVDVPFVHEYLDPTLSIPIMLGLWQLERRYLFGRARLTLLETVVGTLFLMLIFEFVFPLLSTDFTADPWDLVAYSLGGLLYWLFVNNAPAVAGEAQ